MTLWWPSVLAPLGTAVVVLGLLVDVLAVYAPVMFHREGRGLPDQLARTWVVRS